jgi:hypothetical protein
MKALQIRMRSGRFRRGRFVARFEQGIDGEGGSVPASFAEVIVAFVGGDAKDPVFEGRIAAVLAQLEVGLDENFLADVFELGGVAGKTGGHPEDPAFVPEREIGEGVLIPGERGLHELPVRG